MDPAATYAEFTAMFPEFASTTSYPEVQVQSWLDLSPDFLSTTRFREPQKSLATMLWVAHNLVLGRNNQDSAAVGGVPGEAIGNTTSKSVDKVSISYGDRTTIDRAGVWNLTSYGQRLYQLMRAVGTFVYAPGPRRTFNRYGPGYYG